VAAEVAIGGRLLERPHRLDRGTATVTRHERRQPLETFNPVYPCGSADHSDAIGAGSRPALEACACNFPRRYQGVELTIDQDPFQLALNLRPAEEHDVWLDDISIWILAGFGDD